MTTVASSGSSIATAITIAVDVPWREVSVLALRYVPLECAP